MTTQHITENILHITGSNPRKCMKCGKCTATCPAYDEMEYHPHQFVDMIANGRVEELIHSKGLEHCLSCFACLERCPRSVEPAKLIEAVRVTLLREQGVTKLRPEEIPALLDNELPQQALMAAFRKYRK